MEKVNSSAVQSVHEEAEKRELNPFRVPGAETRTNLYEETDEDKTNEEAEEDVIQSEERELRYLYHVIMEKDPRVTIEMRGDEVKLVITADRNERCHEESWEPDEPTCNKSGRRPDTPGTRIYSTKGAGGTTHSIVKTKIIAQH
ncbi:hypothetical protein TKK_0010192 [Trichogramma kaykai]|uniref:Uncharacterized protein n=1 Tax=Trichogramma kaykai TaxID=54128 RepID=A0ABD2X038_9HYME